MRPILFSWRGFHVYSYPAMLYVGVVVGVVVGSREADRYGVSSDRFSLSILILLVPALIGARLLFVGTHWDTYRSDLGRIWRRTDGGAAMYGGFLLALVLSVPLLSVLDLSFGSFWDAATFTMLIAMALTRVGCLLNGCCSGRPTRSRLGLYLPDHTGTWTRRFPTQLLELVWTLVVLLSAVALSGQISFRGGLLLYALAGYGVGRLALTPLRDERERGGRRIAQIVSALFVVVSVPILAVGLQGDRLALGSRPNESLLAVLSVSLLGIVMTFGFVGCEGEIIPGPPNIAGTAGLIAFWKLQDAPGAMIAADETRHFPGTYTGDVLGDIGPFGVAVDLNGGYVTTPLNVGAAAGTIEFFASAADLSDRSACVYVDDADQESHQIGVLPSGLVKAYFLQNSGTPITLISNNPISIDNTWNHYALTWEDNGEVKLYVKGAVASRQPQTNSWKAGTRFLLGGVGAGASGLTQTWSGGLAYVAVYNRALTDNEIASHAL